jgi:hypothetical protein
MIQAATSEHGSSGIYIANNAALDVLNQCSGDELVQKHWVYLTPNIFYKKYNFILFHIKLNTNGIMKIHLIHQIPLHKYFVLYMFTKP